MATLNNCRFIGRLGKKAKISQMGNGKSCASFSLAVDESYKKDGKKISKTEWVSVVVFVEGLVKVIENYTDKGTQIYLEGKLQTRKWTDNNGVDKYTTEIVLQNFNSTLQILDGKKSDDPRNEEKSDGYQEESESIDEDEFSDSIPF